MGLGGQLEEAPRVALLDLAGHRFAVGQSESAREIRSGPYVREREQGERVAVALCDDLVADGPIQGAVHMVQQKCTRVAIAQAAHLQLGDVLELLARRRVRRTRFRPAPPAGDGRQSPASAPTRDRATARRRRHTAADAHRPPPRTSSTPPSPRGTDPGRRRRSARTRSRAPDAAAPEGSGADRASARTADADSRTPTPSRTPPPLPATTATSDADSTRCCSSAVFPIPASPRSTKDRLSPRRTSSINPSRRAHSSARPSSLMHRPGTRNRLCIGSKPG